MFDNRSDLIKEHLAVQEMLATKEQITKLLSSFIEPADNSIALSCTEVISQYHQQLATAKEAVREHPQKQLILQSIMDESLGALPSLLASELIAYQLNIVAKLLDTGDTVEKSATSTLQAIASGKTLFSRIAYELENEITPSKTNIIATCKGDTWQLNGDLPPVLLSPEVNMHLVFAKVEQTQNLAAFVISRNSSGISESSQTQLSISDRFTVANLTLDKVEVGELHRLKHLNPEIIREAFLNHRVLSCLRLNNRTRINLDNITAFLRSRKSNNKPLLDNDVLKQKLATFEAEWLTNKALTNKALTKVLVDDSCKELTHAAKFLTSQLMQQVSKEAMHLGGVKHYQKGSRLSGHYQESFWGTLFLESEEYLLNDIHTETNNYSGNVQ
ncbi:hypothetical protein HR060_00340 [Catenovulum sp. SM1970]|uniref:acyl-CoA dehydrogenase family protein n=1 Tax=Marinifaba aquimaris TaxID=2741323 RepID=UPI0015737E1F|nr:acyl-CoA dehydrogenase family protein [Marinifaba aquimaris]NTS75297.1 hypothetical protein [Marinifaba aquimaris]